MNGEYNDIIHLPHHISQVKPQMSMVGRAAQFSPFAALTGYDDAVREVGRLTDTKIERTDDELCALNGKYQLLVQSLAEKRTISVTYFQPDSRKSGGAYITVSGIVKKLDVTARVLTLTDGTKIPLDEIFDIVRSV